MLVARDRLHAQDGCDDPIQGVDLAVQSARFRHRDDGWIVLYTVVNRGTMESTSYHVALVVDGAVVGDQDDYDVGLAPRHRRRWELALPDDQPNPDGHTVAIRVFTASEGSIAGPSYVDHCASDDEMPASQLHHPPQTRTVTPAA